MADTLRLAVTAQRRYLRSLQVIRSLNCKMILWTKMETSTFGVFASVRMVNILQRVLKTSR